MYHIFVNFIHIYSKIHPCTPQGSRKKALHFIHKHLIQLISITTFHPRAIGTEPSNIGRRPFPVYFLTLGSLHDDVAEIHYRHRSVVVYPAMCGVYSTSSSSSSSSSSSTHTFILCLFSYSANSIFLQSGLVGTNCCRYFVWQQCA